MRIIDLESLPGREIAQFDSLGFAVAPLGVLTPGHVSILRLKPGGVIGRHPSVGTQVLVVVEGSASVSGASGEYAKIRAGQAAVWSPGEDHETRSETGLTAVAIEGSWERGTVKDDQVDQDP